MTNKLKEEELKQKINKILNDYCVRTGTSFLETVDEGYGIYELIQSELASQREEIRGKLEGHMGSSKPIHSKDCIYQRYGCDCGYMEDIGYVDGLKAALSILQEMEGHE